MFLQNHIFFKSKMAIKTSRGWLDLKDFEKGNEILKSALVDVLSFQEAIFKSG